MGFGAHVLYLCAISSFSSGVRLVLLKAKVQGVHQKNGPTLAELRLKITAK